MKVSILIRRGDKIVVIKSRKNRRENLMKKSMRTFLAIIFCLMVSVAAVGATSQSVHADAGKAAVKFLKGKWYCASIHGELGKSNYYVKFTKKYAKYYDLNLNTGKYKYSVKSRIIAAKKTGNGYMIKLKGKICYKTAEDDKNILEYYDTWKPSEFATHYYGSSSLFRQ